MCVRAQSFYPHFFFFFAENQSIFSPCDARDGTVQWMDVVENVCKGFMYIRILKQTNEQMDSKRRSNVTERVSDKVKEKWKKSEKKRSIEKIEINLNNRNIEPLKTCCCLISSSIIALLDER